MTLPRAVLLVMACTCAVPDADGDALGSAFDRVVETRQPSATPDACRSELTVATAKAELMWLAERTRDLRKHTLSIAYDVGDDWRLSVRVVIATAAVERDRTIDRCVADRWSRAMLSCWTESEDQWACARRQLPLDRCLALEHALTMTDHDPMGRCGEPKRRFRR